MVQVSRFDERKRRRLFMVEVEEELSLPGMSELQLFGVVYYDGEELGAKGGGYTCVCRGPPDWRFWVFNGHVRPSLLPKGVSKASFPYADETKAFVSSYTAFQSL